MHFILLLASAAAAAHHCNHGADRDWALLRALSGGVHTGVGTALVEGKRRVELLEQGARAAGRLLNSSAAAALRLEALVLRNVSAADAARDPFAAMKLFAALAQDQRDARQYGEALGTLAAARALLFGPAAPAAATAAAALATVGVAGGTSGAQAVLLEALLLKLEAALVDCRGDAVLAASLFYAALRLMAAAQGGGVEVDDVLRGSVSEATQYLHLLHRAVAAGAAAAASNDDGSSGAAVAADGALQPLHSGGNDGGDGGRGVPRLPAAALRRQYRQLARTLVASGPWRDARQLPTHFTPGLPDAMRVPWHSVADEADGGAADGGAATTPLVHTMPWLQPVVELLRAARAGLRADFDSLRRAGRLVSEGDCIHDAVGGGGGEDAAAAAAANRSSGSVAGAAGSWTVFTVNGPGHAPEELDGACCNAAAAPHACALLARVAALRLRDDGGDAAGGSPLRALTVLRGGFSALGPRTLLRPHFGLTNAQLKFHLGLRVPAARAPVAVPAALLLGHRHRRGSDSSSGGGGGGVGNGSSAAGAGAAEATEEDAASSGDGDAGPGRRYPCAWMAVGGEVRPWRRAGQVWVLDDSFEHAVANLCGSERVAFQLVIGHPLLPQQRDVGGGVMAAASPFEPPPQQPRRLMPAAGAGASSEPRQLMPALIPAPRH